MRYKSYQKAKQSGRGIRAWFYERIGRRRGRLYGYVDNPYLKSAQDCLDTFNAIHGSNLTLKDVYITWDWR